MSPRELTQGCDGLSQDLLGSVLDPGGYFLRTMLGPRREVRTLVAVVAIAPPRDDVGQQTLLLDTIRFVGSERWLISCWHETPTDDGLLNERRTEVRQRLHNDRVEQWRRRSRASGGSARTAGDVGVCALRALAMGWRYGCVKLEGWRREWEVQFLRRLRETEADPATIRRDVARLAELARLAASFGDRVDRLKVPRAAAPTAWFSHVRDDRPAFETDEVIDDTSRDLRTTSDQIRACFGLMHGYNTILLLEQGARSSQFQDLIERVLAVLALPALIAAVYGAQKAPPTQSWWGLGLLVAFVVLGAALGGVGLRLVKRRHERA
jgi:hypothetical protein